MFNKEKGGGVEKSLLIRGEIEKKNDERYRSWQQVGATTKGMPRLPRRPSRRKKIKNLLTLPPAGKVKSLVSLSKRSLSLSLVSAVIVHLRVVHEQFNLTRSGDGGGAS